MIAKFFPTIENKQPYEAGSALTQPYYSIYTADSPYSVKSHGFSAKWYAYSNFTSNPTFDNNSLVFTGNLPFLKYFSGKSWPLFVSNSFFNSDQFGLKAEGYFQAQSSTASFQFYGHGYISFYYKKGATNYKTLSSQQLGITSTEKLVANLTGLTPGNFYLLRLKHWSLSKKNSSDYLLTSSWKDTNIPDRIPLSAGHVVSVKDYSDYTGFIIATRLNYIGNTYVSNTRNELSKFSFTIPLVSSAASIGYKYVSNGDYFEDVKNPSKKIKKFRYIEYYSGYKINGAISTIKRFVGQIRDWTIERGTNNRDVAIIDCVDFGIFLVDAMNTGIPNMSDYLTHGYVSKITGGQDGDVKPRAYDGWLLKDTVNNILISSYIDPKILIQKRKRLNVDNISATGPYLNHEYNLENQIRLDRNFNYGNILSVQGQNEDDPYHWQFPIGENLIDNLQKIMDSYGFRYGFNNEGNFYLKSINNPLKIKSIDNMTEIGSWTEVINTKALYSVSWETDELLDSISATFVGASCKVIFDLKPTYGTIRLILNNPTLGEVINTAVNIQHDKEWHFFDGVDDELGYNPCIYTVGNGLKYGSYELTLIREGANPVSVNAILIYDRDYDSPDFNLYTGKIGTQNPVIVSDLNTESSSSNVRNDIVVLGRLKGIRSQLSTDPNNIEEQNRIVNPNNPVSDYVIARALDRFSIGSVSNLNYTGRPLQMMIIEPNINTDQRALWLAGETAKRFNTFNKVIEPRFDIIGNPLMEIEDYVKVHDLKLNTVTTLQNNFWVKAIVESHEDNKYFNSIELESLKPWQSFFKYPSPSLKRLGNTVFRNVNVFNSGIHSYRNDEFCKLDAVSTIPGVISTLHIQFHRVNVSALGSPSDLNNIIPPQGFLKIKNEILGYNKRNFISMVPQGKPNPAFPEGYFIYNFDIGKLTRGLYSTSTTSLVTLLQSESPLIDLSVSPYSQEILGVVPAIEFDLLFPGHVQVTVRSNEGNLLDSLTGAEVPQFENNWEFLQPGRYFFSWNMVDRIGKHNEVNSWISRYSGGPLDVPGAPLEVLAPADSISQEGGRFSRPPGYGIEEYLIGQGFYAQNQFKKQYSVHNFHVRYKDLSQEHFKGEDTIKSIRPVYVILRRDGRGVGAGSRTNERLIISDNSQLIKTGTGTKWYSTTLNTFIKSAWATPYKRFYTGEENAGLGIKINLKNKFSNVKRLCKLKIERHIFTIVQKYYSPWGGPTSGEYLSPRTATFLTDTLTENFIDDNTFSNIIDGNSGLNMYLKSPDIGFFTPNVIANINSHIGEGLYHVNNDFHPDIIYYISVCHVHFIRCRPVDMSGIHDEFRFSILWRPISVLNTQSDFASNNVKRNEYDNNPYEAADMTPRGPGIFVQFELPFNFRETFPPFAYVSDNKLYLQPRHLLGVVVFGRYQ